MDIPKWALNIAITKVTKKAIQLLISFWIAHNLNQYGISLDQDKLTIAVFAGIELVRNWLKLKLNTKWL